MRVLKNATRGVVLQPALLIEKDICDCRNILNKFLCVCAFSAEIFSIFEKSVLFLFPFFVLSILWYFPFHMVSKMFINYIEFSLIFHKES
jgi:hypothetical protein